MRILLRTMLTLGLFCAALPCGAEELDSLDAGNNERARAERQAHIQLMNDRLINKLPQFSMTGEVKKLGGQSFAINGEAFEVNGDTRIQGRLAAGARAEVRGFLVRGRPKLATQVVVFGENSRGENTDAAPLAAMAEEEAESGGMRPLPR